MSENTSGNRKSESQDTFEQAENAGRFAGNDTDSKAARSLREDRDRNDDTDAEARKDLTLHTIIKANPKM